MAKVCPLMLEPGDAWSIPSVTLKLNPVAEHVAVGVPEMDPAFCDSPGQRLAIETGEPPCIS